MTDPYLQKPWIKAYDDYVPETCAPYPDWIAPDLLTKAAEAAPDTTALIMPVELPLFGRKSREVSYRELKAHTHALAAALQDLNLEKGSRIALLMPNSPQFVISWFAVLGAGHVCVGINPAYPGERLAEMLRDCDAKAIITLSLFYPTIQKIRDKTSLEHVIVTNIKEFFHPLAKFLFTIAKEKQEGHRVEIAAGDIVFTDLLDKYKGQSPSVTVSPDDIAIFQYTGGTTGPSKAAVSTHRAIVSNAIQQNAWLNGTDDPEPGYVTLGALPFFHVFGMITVVLVGIFARSTIVLVPNARDIADVLGNINQYKPDSFPGVPALYNAINAHPDVTSGKVDMSSIQHCISGSAPLPRPTKEEFEKLSGGKLVEGYGMSEMPTATHTNPLNGKNITGSIGVPLPDTICRIVSTEDPTEVLPVGEIGELALTGPQMMLQYHGRPTETKNSVMEADGYRWFLTGDIGYMDEEGYFYIVDRKKDMALIGGFNVYPNQVDQRLNAHPAVAEVAVGVIPHPEKAGQEALKAWVVTNPGMSVTPEELMEFAAEKLARYEIPSRYEFIDAIPRSTVGKILRRELIRMEKERQEREGTPS
jgi:long-chain acyl-CoA synthetase